MLIKIAEIRITAYENWTVKYELMDAALLQALSSRLLPDNFQRLSAEQKALFARTFGQLYSYVFERYILGVDILTKISKRQLASVLIDVEKTVKFGTNSKGLGAIINSSRGIIYAGSDEDFADEIRKAAISLYETINTFR